MAPLPVPGFFLETPHRPISSRDAVWNQPLPAGPGGKGTEAVTCGQLLEAVAGFVLDRIDRLTQRPPERIAILLAKHGAFYHPCKVVFDDDMAAVAVNAAVSRQARELAEVEFSNLHRLYHQAGENLVARPLVVDHRELPGGRRVTLLATGWLEGFCECHRTGRPEGDQVVLWDPEGGDRLLAEVEQAVVLERGAELLTSCLDPVGLEAVGLFHMAAGDLVVRPGPGRLQVRLISVRRYGPYMAGDGPAQGLEEVLEGLLIYFLRLSLQLRLDRIDGTGRPALWHRRHLARVCNGFFTGLQRCCRRHGLPDTLVAAARAYLGGLGAGHWQALVEETVSRLPLTSDERSLLAAETRSHGRELYAAVRSP